MPISSEEEITGAVYPDINLTFPQVHLLGLSFRFLVYKTQASRSQEKNSRPMLNDYKEERSDEHQIGQEEWVKVALYRYHIYRAIGYY